MSSLPQHRTGNISLAMSTETLLNSLRPGGVFMDGRLEKHRVSLKEQKFFQ